MILVLVHFGNAPYKNRWSSFRQSIFITFFRRTNVAMNSNSAVFVSEN